MDICDLKLRQHLVAPGSVTDLRAKLFPKAKLDRSPVISEERYTSKTLQGNWFERRVVYVRPPDDWKSLYQMDYKIHVDDSWKKHRITRWDNKLNLEGLPREKLIDHHGRAYYDNLTTTYDLCYNVLPKRNEVKQDLTRNYGNLTQFGLREALKNMWFNNSEEGLAQCHWRTTYMEEVGRQNAEDLKFKRKPRANMNEPNIQHLQHKHPDLRSCLNPHLIEN